MQLNTSDRSQISSSHRLIESTKKLRHRLDLNGGIGENFSFIEQDYFIKNILHRVKEEAEFEIGKRLQAIIHRIEKTNKQSSTIDYAVEALFDSYFFKNNERYVNRENVSKILKKSIDESDKITIVMPILSRKPISPIKNKGYFPDLGEINTLIRCYSISKIISILSEKTCEFIILSDGNKYRRACHTPPHTVDLYQTSLKYWIKELNLSNFIKVVDYEKWIYSYDRFLWENDRVEIYNDYYKSISCQLDNIFSSDNSLLSLNNLESYDLRGQLNYTFQSIITSVNYHSLYRY